MMRRSSLAERAIRGVRDPEPKDEPIDQFPAFEDIVFPDIQD